MTNGKGPLNGIRVIDLGRHQAGPRCAQVLARLGAEVIKIERLGGEETRYHGPWVRKQSAYWVQYNSGKKSVSMDLRKEEGEGGPAQADQGFRRARAELPPRDHRGDGLRVRRAEGAEPPHHHGQRLRLRAVRSLSRPDRLRPHRPDHVRHRHGHRRGGHAADSRRCPDHRPHHRAALRHRHPGRPLRAQHFRRGAEHRRLPGGLRLQPDRDPHHRLSRGRHRAQAGPVRFRAQRHVPLQGRLGPDCRRRPAPLAAGVQRPGKARVAGQTRASPPAASAASTRRS